MIRINMADMQDCLGCSQPAPEMDAVHYIGYQPASAKIEAVHFICGQPTVTCKPIQIWLANSSDSG
jgi:hypothetical protein